mmetsp:Transcript_103775/g.268601  ORF Transcript_103775/g.268601 Transcript_103775/m.268601 type:complete len:279 (-) Transcript_103775:434-1270(-)
MLVLPPCCATVGLRLPPPPTVTPLPKREPSDEGDKAPRRWAAEPPTPPLPPPGGAAPLVAALPLAREPTLAVVVTLPPAAAEMEPPGVRMPPRRDVSASTASMPVDRRCPPRLPLDCCCACLPRAASSAVMAVVPVGTTTACACRARFLALVDTQVAGERPGPKAGKGAVEMLGAATMPWSPCARRACASTEPLASLSKSASCAQRGPPTRPGVGARGCTGHLGRGCPERFMPAAAYFPRTEYRCANLAVIATGWTSKPPLSLLMHKMAPSFGVEESQ